MSGLYDRTFYSRHSALTALEKLRGLPHLIYLCARYIGADGRKVVAGYRPYGRYILQGRRLPAPIALHREHPAHGAPYFIFL